MSHQTGTPSDWIRRWHTLVPAHGTCLDLACGSGRHARWLTLQGLKVCAVDKNANALAQLQHDVPALECITADLESGAWPLAGRRFDAVVVTHYLWRDRWPELLDCLNPGGVLMYETFSVDHAHVGHPSRPEFVLRHGELLTLCAGLRIVAFEEGYLDDPPRFVQRIVAVAGLPAVPAPGESPRRHPLAPPPAFTTPTDQ